MTPSLNSRSFKADSTTQVEETLREIVAAMPIVIFANAIRDAFSRRPVKRAPVATRTFSTR